MFYRVDYVVAVLLAGFIFGALFSRATSHVEPSRLARRYFALVAAIIALHVALFVCIVMMPTTTAWYMPYAAVGDVGNLLFGVIFGLAARRSDKRELLCDPAIFSIFCLSAGVGFVTTGYLNASLGTKSMSQFFIQSGYSAHFQMFIATAELLGGSRVVRMCGSHRWDAGAPRTAPRGHSSVEDQRERTHRVIHCAFTCELLQ